MTSEPQEKTPKKIPILAVLMVGIPVIALIFIAAMVSNLDNVTAKQYDADHLKMQELKNQTILLERVVIQQNQTITNLVNFLVNQQIPLDVGLLANDTKLNNTIHHR